MSLVLSTPSRCFAEVHLSSSMANAEKKQGRDSRRGLHLIRLLADSVVEATCSLSHSRFYLWPRDHVPPAFTHVERAGPYHEREEIDWSGLTRSSHRTVTRGRKRSIPPLSLALYFPLCVCFLSVIGFFVSARVCNLFSFEWAEESGVEGRWGRTKGLISWTLIRLNLPDCEARSVACLRGFSVHAHLTYAACRRTVPGCEQFPVFRAALRVLVFAPCVDSNRNGRPFVFSGRLLFSVCSLSRSSRDHSLPVLCSGISEGAKEFKWEY